MKTMIPLAVIGQLALGGAALAEPPAATDDPTPVSLGLVISNVEAAIETVPPEAAPVVEAAPAALPELPPDPAPVAATPDPEDGMPDAESVVETAAPVETGPAEPAPPPVAAAPPWPAVNPHDGAFEELLPANRKVAGALHAAQKPGAGEPWSRDRIAAAHLAGKWWEEVFEEMKAAGLVEGKSLTQLVEAHAPPAPLLRRSAANSLDTPDRDPERVELERNAHHAAPVVAAAANAKGGSGRGALGGLRRGSAGAVAATGKGAGKVAGGIGNLTR